ncbi:MAG: hypothetical protein LBD55_09110 [Treponema sp.]|nr:hypothetical protein [Treponema sp.]
MALFNGKGPYFCKNCNGGEGIHRGDDLACPANGIDQTGTHNPRYIEGTHFAPQEWQKDIENGAVKGEKTIFDEYFTAILNGCASGVLDIRDAYFQRLVIDCGLVDWAYKLTLAALKKRNEYIKSIALGGK